MTAAAAAAAAQVREFVNQIGHENLNKRLVNSKEGKVKFEKPSMGLEVLMNYGKALVGEQDNVKRVQLADAYLGGAELAGSTGSSVPEQYDGEHKGSKVCVQGVAAGVVHETVCGAIVQTSVEGTWCCP